MTISAKLSDIAGLEFIVSDPTDTDDLNGFSDEQTTVGGESAKFSGGATMQANSGKKIGISQVKFETSITDLSARTIQSSSGVTNPTQAIDDNDTTAAFFTNINDELIVDFGSSITAVLKSTGSRTVGGNHSITITRSTDNITYFAFATVNYTEAKQTVTHGNATFRFIKFVSSTSTSAASVFSIFVEDTSGDKVTVQLLSTSALDGTSGTTMIGSTVLTATSRDLGSSTNITTFNSTLLLTDATHFVTLRIVSFDGIFDVPVTLSSITSVKEV